LRKEADTPPVVGSVRMLMYGRPASRCCAIAADVLAICMRESTPSCIRAPPDVLTRTERDLLVEGAPRQPRDLLTHH
jgi:hypothetical protein